MEEIELRELFFIVWKKKWLIVLITLISIIASAIISFFILPSEYETYTTLMVGKSKEYSGMNQGIEYNDVLLNKQLVSTYGELAKSRAVGQKVIEDLDLDMSHGAFSEKVNVSLVNDTEIIKIVVSHKDPEETAIIANKTAEVFMEEVKEKMKIDNVQVIDKALVPEGPVSPKPMLNIAIAAVLGIMISVFIIFILEYLDNTIKTPNDVEKHLGLPVIGMIPKTADK
ncbi:YveK family protein [Senegalia massiliensis]|uniref:YveK family protein n=1 Tax=Senegalia massiliensis TaxID=1720316 RepID=UPI00191C4537|nr:Wzz/FepE/Etk N-terminal domain-containing protein [Senegalia massiliensis]